MDLEKLTGINFEELGGKICSSFLANLHCRASCSAGEINSYNSIQ